MTIKKTIYNMLIENTGVHMMDSGGDNGRAWQRNQGKTLKDFEDGDAVIYDTKDVRGVLEGDFSVSVYHYLTSGFLMFDVLTDEFNALSVDNWDSDIYGVSEEGAEWLEAHGFEIGESWNTYNGTCFLSQTLQGTNCKHNGDNYVLLQVHGGADVRGGYTDAKLFKLDTEYMPDYNAVYGHITLKNGEQVNISSMYDGYSLTLEDDGADVPEDIIKQASEIYLNTSYDY